MQTITAFLSAASPAAVWTDALNDRIGEPPVLPIGATVDLRIRLFGQRIGQGVTPIDAGALEDVTSWEIALADSVGSTVLLTTPGTLTTDAAGDTFFAATITTTANALTDAVGTDSTIDVLGEITGTTAAGLDVCVWRLPAVILLNRL